MKQNYYSYPEAFSHVDVYRTINANPESLIEDDLPNPSSSPFKTLIYIHANWFGNDAVSYRFVFYNDEDDIISEETWHYQP